MVFVCEGGGGAWSRMDDLQRVGMDRSFVPYAVNKHNSGCILTKLTDDWAWSMPRSRSSEDRPCRITK